MLPTRTTSQTSVTRFVNGGWWEMCFVQMQIPWRRRSLTGRSTWRRPEPPPPPTPPSNMWETTHHLHLSLCSHPLSDPLNTDSCINTTCRNTLMTRWSELWHHSVNAARWLCSPWGLHRHKTQWFGDYITKPKQHTTHKGSNLRMLESPVTKLQQSLSEVMGTLLWHEDKEENATNLIV